MAKFQGYELYKVYEFETKYIKQKLVFWKWCEKKMLALLDCKEAPANNPAYDGWTMFGVRVEIKSTHGSKASTLMSCLKGMNGKLMGAQKRALKHALMDEVQAMMVVCRYYNGKMYFKIVPYWFAKLNDHEVTILVSEIKGC